MLNINNTLDGYLKNIEIFGNTVQDVSNLADIQSVGSKLEGQELYEISILSTNGLNSIDVNYQEDKLTILSPTPLEKVGNVADIILCKDGIWGVEKNNINLDINSVTVYDSVSIDTNTVMVACLFDNVILPPSRDSLDVICDCFLPNSNYAIDEEGLFVAFACDNKIFIRINKSKLNNDFSVSNIRKYLVDNIKVLKVNAKNPRFIPLPYDQQINLRTFANKTNISFLTEIEGTIKAQMPKSLGATVNTHTEQISNLSKELDRVKRLEENTLSIIETEGNFVTVEATSNGYFEAVKLEGKTLILNSNNEIVNSGDADARLVSVGDGVDEIVVSSTNSDTTQSDKKRLLYYNEKTQTWEKLTLREWDSIEKHSDGKYYYHKRSEEALLDGSEKWSKPSSQPTNTSRYLLVGFPNISTTKIISTMKVKSSVVADEVGIWCDANTIINTPLDIASVEDFKQWLQANNVPVVYRLAQEEVYECSNIDLITYISETNYRIECGVITPKTTLKIHNDITNVVRMLQEKVSILEDTFITGLKQVLAGDTYSLAELLYPEDFK